MSIGLFTDKKRQPSDAEIRAALGDRLPLWEELAQSIRQSYPAAQEDIKFLYGQKYGWALRFRLGSQLLTSLYPTQGGFTAQVNLPEAAVQQALREGLGQSAQRAIARATLYSEGRWLFIAVESAADAADIRRLLALRVKAKHLQ
jgi:hypothetical protein